MWCAARHACAGASDWNLPPKPIRAISFLFRPTVPHQEINANQILECVLVRSDGEAIAINLDIEPVEKPETVLWVDPIHRDPSESK